VSDIDNTVTYDAAGDFTTVGLGSTGTGNTLTGGVKNLRDLGDELGKTSLLGQELAILSATATPDDPGSIGNYVDLREILDEYLVQPIVGEGDDPTLDGLVSALNVSDDSRIAGLTVSLAANAALATDGTLTIELSLDAKRVTTGFELDLLGGIEERLIEDRLTATLTTAVLWDFSVGVDASGFFGIFDTDNHLDVRADISSDGTTGSYRAGFLGLDALNTSLIVLDADVLVDTDALNAGIVPANAADLNQTGAALLDIDLELGATGVTGVNQSLLTFDDDLFTAAAPVLTDDFDSSGVGVSDFYKTEAGTVRQLLQQFRTFLDSFDAKALNLPIPLAAGQTVGDIFDLAGQFQMEILDLIELPPHMAGTLLTDVIGQPTGSETLAEQFGTSGDGAAEFTVTLRDGSTFDVNLDPVTTTSTLGAVTDLIKAAAANPSKFDVIANADGSLTLVDKTAATDGEKFSVTPKKDGAG